jgi:hypothetical protein
MARMTKIRNSKGFGFMGTLSKGKHQRRVKPRSLFCYWAVRELGIPITEVARRLGISVPGVGYSVDRGENIARENDYQVIN